jgi:hypothetical protein
MTEKKVWVEPVLIVLVRSRPEEVILGVCKNLVIIANPSLFHQGCALDPTGACENCNSIGFS